MRIALINENSQAAKNGLIKETLENAVKEQGHTVLNYGMSDDHDGFLTYVQAGILAALVLNAGAADYVITGCGTGEGAMLACNAFAGVQCGHVEDAVDAITFNKINAGNAVSIPFAKGFGWGAELNLDLIFRGLFSEEPGLGYPADRAVPERNNRIILDQVKARSTRKLADVLPELDPDLVLGCFSTKGFKEHFFEEAKEQELVKLVRTLMEEK